MICLIFVNLRVEMRNVFIKILAMVLTVWYSMSIIGFDVHTCSGSGRSFVTSFIEGMTCEDIHPEHVCNPESCCADAHETDGHGCCGHSHHEGMNTHSDCLYCDGMAFEAKSCCSNDYQVLHLTGTLSSDDHRHYDECGCGLCPCILPYSHGNDTPLVFRNLIAYIQEPDSGLSAAGDRQAALSIWRI